jgi:hypothetical protein
MAGTGAATESRQREEGDDSHSVLFSGRHDERERRAWTGLTKKRKLDFAAALASPPQLYKPAVSIHWLESKPGAAERHAVSRLGSR